MSEAVSHIGATVQGPVSRLLERRRSSLLPGELESAATAAAATHRISIISNGSASSNGSSLSIDVRRLMISGREEATPRAPGSQSRASLWGKTAPK